MRYLLIVVNLAKDHYETEKMIGDLGLSYDKIYACSNVCQLYWNYLIQDEVHSTSDASTWQIVEGEINMSQFCL